MTRRLLLLGCCVLAVGLIVAGAGRPLRAADEPPAATAPPLDSVVRVVIDYRDGVEKVFVAIPYRPDMTVLDALTDAGRHPRGVKIEVTGKGEVAFVRKIDDLANQGGGKSARNWMFSVDGKPGTRGCGVTKLKQSDVVLWKFATFDESR